MDTPLWEAKNVHSDNLCKIIIILHVESSVNASFECAKFCVLGSSHYNRLLKSREKFKQWHLQFFQALARRDSRLSSCERVVTYF